MSRPTEHDIERAVREAFAKVMANLDRERGHG